MIRWCLCELTHNLENSFEIVCKKKTDSECECESETWCKSIQTNTRRYEGKKFNAEKGKNYY